MRKFQFAKVLFLITVSLFLTLSVFAQSDGERFAEGRIAFDKYKDCPAALKSLEGVSQAGRNNPLWIYYFAQVNECVENFQEALTYYEKYNLLVPGQGEVVDKIGELRYKARKQQDEIDKKNDPNSEFARNALIEAIYKGQDEKINSLIKSGVKLSEVEFGGIMIAACVSKEPLKSRLPMVLNSIKAGMNIDDKDSYTGTKFVVRSIEGNSENIEILKVFISAGAKLNSTTKEGLTTLDVAILYQCNPELIKVLLEAGAKSSGRKTSLGFDVPVKWAKKECPSVYQVLRANGIQ